MLNNDEELGDGEVKGEGVNGKKGMRPRKMFESFLLSGSCHHARPTRSDDVSIVPLCVSSLAKPTAPTHVDNDGP